MKMLSKKASANMWWIIIGAVVALVVMIILMVMFTDTVRPLEEGLSECEGKSGICTGSVNVCPKNTLKTSAFDCNQGVCCIGAPKECAGVVDIATCAPDNCVNYGDVSYCVKSEYEIQ